MSSINLLLACSPTIFADSPAQATYNSHNLIVNVPHFEEGILPVQKRVLRCGVVGADKQSPLQGFKAQQFVEYVLKSDDRQISIPAGTVPTYFGKYRQINNDGSISIPTSQSGSRAPLPEGQIFHCRLDRFFIKGGNFIATDGYATVEAGTKSITWTTKPDGSTSVTVEK